MRCELFNLIIKDANRGWQLKVKWASWVRFKVCKAYTHPRSRLLSWARGQSIHPGMEEKLMVEKWLCWKGAGIVCEEFVFGLLGSKEPIRVLSCRMIRCTFHGRKIILIKKCSINLGVKKLEEFSNPDQHIHSRNKTEWIVVWKACSERIYKNCVVLDWVLVVRDIRTVSLFCFVLLIAKCWRFHLQLPKYVGFLPPIKTYWSWMMCWKTSIMIKSKMSFVRNGRDVRSRKKSKVRSYS